MSKIQYFKIVREFIRFLKDHSIYLEFRQYSSKEQYQGEWQKKDYPRPSLFYINTKSQPCMEEAINWAFEWTRTEEGSDFWSDLDEEWRKLYQNIQ